MTYNYSVIDKGQISLKFKAFCTKMGSWQIFQRKLLYNFGLLPSLPTQAQILHVLSTIYFQEDLIKNKPERFSHTKL